MTMGQYDTSFFSLKATFHFENVSIIIIIVKASCVSYSECSCVFKHQTFISTDIYSEFDI